MLPVEEEPTSAEAVRAWVRRQTHSHDVFADVYDASEAHRSEHGCDLYPTGNGPLLGLLAAARRPGRILEVGCGLGYSALWMAHGAGAGATVETIERDSLHADLARRQCARHDAEHRITVHTGDALRVLPTLEPPYDLVFCDSDVDQYPAFLDEFLRLVPAEGGLIITSNLFLGVYIPDNPWPEQSAEYRRRILEDRRLMTVFLPSGHALSVTRDRGQS
ncbi:MAG: class I SAM-dependent methyltransferase [Dehalococcoidia bacterium]